jgi:isoquinoline 1-oxidoreductase alpha subunit
MPGPNESAQQPAVGDPNAIAVTLQVNGKKHDLRIDPRTSLLDCLREHLQLTGSKKGCDHGQCGACTVHINGVATRSCQRRVSTLANAEITTIEGLSPAGTSPLQRAWEELDVPQCGYCQAGQLMSATALLAKTPKPTDADIDAAMNGNICRCTTYLRIRSAIHRAAEMTASTK